MNMQGVAMGFIVLSSVLANVLAGPNESELVVAQSLGACDHVVAWEGTTAQGTASCERPSRAVERPTRLPETGDPDRVARQSGVDWSTPVPKTEPTFCGTETGGVETGCRVVLIDECASRGLDVVSPVDTGEFSGYVCASLQIPEAEEIEEQDDAVDIMALLPGAVEEAFATLPISGGSVEFEPDLLGFGYKGRHTHIFAETETQTLNETLLGIPVEIRVHPQTFHWDYGDGSTRTTYDPGEPLPNDWQGDAVVKTNQETPTSHVYSETGRYPVSLTTTFVGEYRVGGGPWIVIPGSVDVQASPGEADIWRVAARNVSGSCRNTSDWGCDGPVTLEPGDTPPKIFAHLYDENGNWLGW